MLNAVTFPQYSESNNLGGINGHRYCPLSSLHIGQQPSLLPVAIRLLTVLIDHQDRTLGVVQNGLAR